MRKTLTLTLIAALAAGAAVVGAADAAPARADRAPIARPLLKLPAAPGGGLLYMFRGRAIIPYPRGCKLGHAWPGFGAVGARGDVTIRLRGRGPWVITARRRNGTIARHPTVVVVVRCRAGGTIAER